MFLGYRGGNERFCSVVFPVLGQGGKGRGEVSPAAVSFLDVAGVGHTLLSVDAMLRQRFATVTGLDESVCCKWLIMLLALHDIGKFSESFQNVRPDLLEQLQSLTSRKQYQTRHDSLGNLYLKSALEREDLAFPPGLSFYDWQDVVLSMVRPFVGHHGIPPKMQADNGLQLRLPHYFSDNDTVAARQLAEAVTVLMCGEEREWPLPSPEELEAKMKKASWLMAGFVVLCDWIGSNNRWFPFYSDEMTLDDYWRNHALPQAEKALREAGINTGISLAELSGFFGLFPHIATPTPLQAFVETCPVGNSPQLSILEDVTGSGKTEAALLLARRMMAAGSGKGIFVALPTMATSNAMYNRLAEHPVLNTPPLYLRLFEKNSKPSIVLAHGARHLSETFMASVAGRNTEASGEEAASAQCSSWLADNRKKALLADVGVGTLDQALLAVLSDGQGP